MGLKWLPFCINQLTFASLAVESNRQRPGPAAEELYHPGVDPSTPQPVCAGLQSADVHNDHLRDEGSWTLGAAAVGDRC